MGCRSAGFCSVWVVDGGGGCGCGCGCLYDASGYTPLYSYTLLSYPMLCCAALRFLRQLSMEQGLEFNLLEDV